MVTESEYNNNVSILILNLVIFLILLRLWFSEYLDMVLRIEWLETLGEVVHN